MKAKKFFALLTLSTFLTLCLTVAAGAAMSDKDFYHLCMRGTVQEINAELMNGANPNAKDNDGMTGLMWAAYENPDPEVISLLLKVGADINAEDNIRHTALMWAAMHNKNPEVISVLLKAGADVNAKIEVGVFKGWTALMFAARSNENSEVVSLLLKAGADVNAKDKRGKTALDYAREKGNDAAIKVLEAAGGKGNPETMYQLGLKYATGDGVKADEKKGVELLRKAAEQGHQKAKDALKLFE